MNLDKHLAEITRLRKLADELPDDLPHALMEKIELLAKTLVYVGRVSAQLDEDYKRLYALRKRTWAEARIKATKDKEAVAELAVADLRDQEAQAYGDMRRFRNAFESLTEEIHSLKLRMKMDFEQGGASGHGQLHAQRGSKASA